MAAHSGVPTIIASARTPDLIEQALMGGQVGTWVDPRPERLSARKLFIAFGLESAGSVVVDAGAVTALIEHARSLLPVGITEVKGAFRSEEAINVIGPDGRLIGRGLAAIPADELIGLIGQKGSREAIHRDDLVILA
jgi:glutamate 5-kinase